MGLDGWLDARQGGKRGSWQDIGGGVGGGGEGTLQDPEQSPDSGIGVVGSFMYFLLGRGGGKCIVSGTSQSQELKAVGWSPMKALEERCPSRQLCILFIRGQLRFMDPQCKPYT